MVLSCIPSMVIHSTIHAYPYILPQVERSKFYSEQIPQERTVSNSIVSLPLDWPLHGTISMHQISLRYRAGLPLILDNISIQIHAGERIGVVGRTGIYLFGDACSFPHRVFSMISWFAYALRSRQIKLDGCDFSFSGARCWSNRN